VRFRLSIRTRVVLAVALITAVGFSVLAIVLARYSLDRQIRQVDDELDIDEGVVIQLFVAARAEGQPIVRLSDTGRLVQLVDADGDLLLDNTSSAGIPALVDASELRDRNLTKAIPGLERTRIRVRQVPWNEPAYLVIGRSVEQIYDANDALARSLVIAVPALVLVSMTVAWFAIGRALRPVEVIRASAENLRARDLGGRIASPNTGDEVQRLADTMNALLGRLEAAAQRERRLVDDASHELRSPGTAVRALVESRPTDPEAAARHDRAAVAALDRLQVLMDQLLVQARYDQRGPAPTTPVDLDDLLLEHAAQLGADHPELHVDTTQVSGGQVTGHRDDLNRLIANLTSNAAHHARSTVTCSLVEQDGRVHLAVEDDGPGIPLPDRERVFDRFVRLDDARPHVGAGLGLSIARGIVEVHGGTIRATGRADGATGARLAVDLPAHL